MDRTALTTLGAESRPAGATEEQNGRFDHQLQRLSREETLALQSMAGDYQVAVRDGAISLVQPATASAEFVVKVERGTVDSVVPLAGTHSRTRQDYMGRTNDGTHRVALTVTNGNVIID